jgi:hypothetical protein
MKDIYSANNCVISDQQSEQQFLNSIKLLEVELAKLNDEFCVHDETVDVLNMSTEGCPNSLPKSFPTKALRGFKPLQPTGDSEVIKFN